MMPGPRKKNLRLAIKKMAIASPEKVLREEAIFNLAHVLHERPGWKPSRITAGKPSIY